MNKVIKLTITVTLSLLTSCAAQPIKVKPKKHYFSPALVEGVKHFENHSLATGKTKSDKKRWDKYGCKWEISYGFTQDLVDEAIRQGYLPKGSKLPSYQTRQEAHEYLINVALPTFQSVVLQSVDVELKEREKEALIMFAYNLGSGALKKLVGDGTQGRLNSGNKSRTLQVLAQYRKAGGKVLKGLVRRRKYETQLFKGEI